MSITTRPADMREIHDWALALPHNDRWWAVICFGGDRAACCPDGGVVALDDGAIVAAASISRGGEDGHGPEIVGLLCDPQRRRQGFGRAALLAAAGRARDELGLALPLRVDCLTVEALAVCESLPAGLLDVHDWTDAGIAPHNWIDKKELPMTTIEFAAVAARAGFAPGPDGRLNLPATQETADALAAAALGLLGPWSPGDGPGPDVTLTGAGPVWGHLCIAHALHGRARTLAYAAPNAPAISVFRHGA